MTPRRSDWRKLRTTVGTAVRFLDDVNEVNKYPLPEIERATRGTRKIGLGVMSFAEMLIRLGLSYDSAAAVELAGELTGVLATEAHKMSEQLAEERGVFPPLARERLLGPTAEQPQRDMSGHRPHWHAQHPR